MEKKYFGWTQVSKIQILKAIEICFFFFFFRGTFHNIFKLDTRCTYDCIGTSGKKFPKPPWEGFVHKTTAEGIWLGTL